MSYTVKCNTKATCPGMAAQHLGCLWWAGDRLTLQQQAAFVGHFPMESYQPDDAAAPSRRVIALATSCAAAAVIVLTLVAFGAQHGVLSQPHSKR